MKRNQTKKIYIRPCVKSYALDNTATICAASGLPTKIHSEMGDGQLSKSNTMTEETYPAQTSIWDNEE
jgi:hypothetical protein